MILPWRTGKGQTEGAEGVGRAREGEGGSGARGARLGRVQARENRGARYRVTNSATPEIHPFIGAHQVRGCIQEKPRPPTRISILSHRRQAWGSVKQNDPVCNRDPRKKESSP